MNRGNIRKQILTLQSERIFTAFILAMLFFSGLASAQQNRAEKKLRAGDKLPKSDLILPGGKPRREQFISYLLRDGKRQNLSYLSRTLETVRKENGQTVLRLVQRYEDAGGINVDTSEMLLKNLLPVSYHSDLATQTETFDFLPDKVKGIVTRKNGETKNYATQLEEPVYNAVVLNELIQSLPLAENYAARFRAVNPGKQFLTMTVRVTGSEKVLVAGGKTIDAWLVRLDGSNAPVIYWVAKNTQEMLKQKAELKNGDQFWRVRLYE